MLPGKPAVRWEEIEALQKQYGVKKLPFLHGLHFSQDVPELVPADLRGTAIQADFIFSLAVLEHVPDPEGLIQKIYRQLSPGGYSWHFIDLSDHYPAQTPFLFLKYSDFTWERLLTKKGVSYTNRVRHDDFIRYFKQAGFEILETQTQRKPCRQKRLNKKFRGRTDLDIIRLAILCRKPFS